MELTNTHLKGGLQMRRVSSLLTFVAGVICMSAFITGRCEAQGGFGTRATAGIFGGVTFPRGDFRDVVGTGWHAGALAKIRLYGPLDARLDGAYSKFGKKHIEGTIAALDTDASATIGTLNALLNLGPDSAAYPGDNTVSPYLLGGVGKYRLDFKAVCTGDCAEPVDPGIRTHWGFNIGGGGTVPVAGIRTFLEARYHRISLSQGSRSMFLLSAGVKIR
jgi:hypothetical protein